MEEGKEKKRRLISITFVSISCTALRADDNYATTNGNIMTRNRLSFAFRHTEKKKKKESIDHPAEKIPFDRSLFFSPPQNQ